MHTYQTGYNPEYTEEAPTLDQLNNIVGDAILEFGAPWCGHCQTAEYVVKDSLTEYANLPHIKVYDGKGKRLGRIFKVKLWPTLILLKNGKEIARLIRPVNTDEVMELLSQSK